MTTIYLIREKIRKFFSYYGRFFMPAVKFFVCLLIFSELNKHIGFFEKLTNPIVTVVLAAIGMVVPSSVVVLLAALISLLHLYQASVVLMAVVLVIYIVLFLLLGRFDPDHGFVLLLMPLLFIYHIPYLMPLLLGMFASPITIIPMVCGTAIYFVLEVIRTAAGTSSGFDIEEALVLANSIFDSILANRLMFASVIVLSATLLVVYIIRRLKVKYSFEIAIVAGTVFCIVGYIIVNMKIPGAVSVGSMILLALLSGIITYLVHFMQLALDYSRTENARFEDDDYYYYVTAVPKIFVTETNKKVKKFSGKDAEEEPEEDDDVKVVPDKEEIEEILDEEEEFMRDFAEREEDY
ncbi:MAG: hypothetical protein IJ744_04380 [Lachnospiraceae bacterium]|nr:hypothetical protein [Lachnospiraceae bacterium]